MEKRLPTILGKAIEDVARTVNENSDEDIIIDLVQCIERMEALMHDLSTNQKLRPIIDDGEGDSQCITPDKHLLEPTLTLLQH